MGSAAIVVLVNVTAAEVISIFNLAIACTSVYSLLHVMTSLGLGRN